MHVQPWKCVLFVSLWASAAAAQEYPRIGYVYPAGGRQGTVTV